MKLLYTALASSILLLPATTVHADTNQTNQAQAYTRFELKGGSSYSKDYNQYAVDPKTADQVLSNFSKDTNIPLDNNKVYTIDTYQQPAGSYAINAYEPHETYDHLLWGFSYNPTTHESHSLYTDSQLNYWHQAEDGTYINPDMSMGQTIVHNDPASFPPYEQTQSRPIFQPGDNVPEQWQIANQPDNLIRTDHADPNANTDRPQLETNSTIPNDQTQNLPQTGNQTSWASLGLGLTSLAMMFGLLKRG